ncbi:MAG: para-aminobenzoate synthetase component 1 [Cellvibrionaceae bacterium]
MSQAAIIPIPYHRDSERYFSGLQNLPYSCWLDSGKPASNYGRYDIMAAMPCYRLVTEGKNTRTIRCEYEFQSQQTADTDGVGPVSRVSISEQLESQVESDPLALLQKHIDSLSSVTSEEIPFIGGAIGYFAYSLGYRRHGIVEADSVEKTMCNRQISVASPFADMQVGIYHWAVIQDHQRQKSHLVALPECDARLLDFVSAVLTANTFRNVGKFQTDRLNSSLTRPAYLSQLDRIHNYILAGDCYQVNFSQQFYGRYQGNPYAAYQMLRRSMASPFSAYLQFGKQAILSLSPERFLQVKQREVLTQPIKGTCRRAGDAHIDRQNALSLQRSEKNRAENVMIVDLLRNDLGQQCIPGSVKVENLFALESFPNVHHLVSSVRGTLREGVTVLDLLRDCFPGGSITGAPKRRAMEIIHELEPVARGIYCGSIGYINSRGDMDTNIAIRTVACDGEMLYCSGGGGIVADSKPAAEYQESLDKIHTILEILREGI